MRITGKGTILLSLLILLMLAVPLPASAAQPEITITNAFVENQYPVSFTVFIEFEDDIQVSSAVLNLQSKGDEDIIQTDQFQVNANQISWTVNIAAELPLPPFSKIDYWTLLTLPDGTIYQSPTFAFYFSDNRYDFTRIETDHMSLYYQNADEDTLNQFVTRTTAIDKNILSFLALESLPDKRLVVYQNQNDLPAFVTPYDGTGTIVIPAGEESSETTQHLVSREILSLTLKAEFPLHYYYIPDWIVEGLAYWVSPVPKDEVSEKLQIALSRGQISSISQLCDAYPAEYDQYQTAAMQSYSMLKYIETNRGDGSLLELIDLDTKGISCTDQIQTLMEVTPEEFLINWELATFTTVHQTESFVPWVILLAGVFITLFSPLILRPEIKVQSDEH